VLDEDVHEGIRSGPAPCAGAERDAEQQVAVRVRELAIHERRRLDLQRREVQEINDIERENGATQLRGVRGHAEHRLEQRIVRARGHRGGEPEHAASHGRCA